MRFALETNTLVLELNSLKTLVRTSATHTQLATSDFQTDLMLRWCYSQVLTSKNGRFLALVLTFEYATFASYIYAVAFSAGLNSLQVQQVDRKTICELLLMHNQFLANLSLPVTHTFSIPCAAWLYMYVPHPQLLREKPRKCLKENAKRLGNSFMAVAHQS